MMRSGDVKAFETLGVVVCRAADPRPKTEYGDNDSGSTRVRLLLEKAFQASDAQFNALPQIRVMT